MPSVAVLHLYLDLFAVFNVKPVQWLSVTAVSSTVEIVWLAAQSQVAPTLHYMFCISAKVGGILVPV